MNFYRRSSAIADQKNAKDREAWNIEDEYMYGGRLLVAPVLESGAAIRKLYLPDEGIIWMDAETNETYQGGNWIQKNITLESIPVFVRQ